MLSSSVFAKRPSRRSLDSFSCLIPLPHSHRLTIFRPPPLRAPKSRRPLPLRARKPRRINTYKSLSKQRILTSCRTIDLRKTPGEGCASNSIFSTSTFNFQLSTSCPSRFLCNSVFSPSTFNFQLSTSCPSRVLSSQPLTNCPPHNLFLLTSLQMPGGIGDSVQEFLKHYFNYGRISGRLNHLQKLGSTNHISSATTAVLLIVTSLHRYFITSRRVLSSGPSVLPMLSIIRRRCDAHAPKLIAVILLEEHVPLFAALQDFLLVRRNLLADIQLHFLFFLQRGRQDQHHLLSDSVPVVHKFHVVARHQHFRNLVRQS